MDENKNKWNYIVSERKNLFYEKEEKIQAKWEGYCSDLFGYKKYLGEIASQRVEPVGSIGRIIPDIILKRNGEDICDIELKQYSLSFDSNMEKQLTSYMKIVSAKVGILVCNDIFVYYYDFNKKEYISCKVVFDLDNPDGIKLAELLTKENFKEEEFEAFIKEVNSRKEIIEEPYYFGLDERDGSFGYQAYAIYLEMCDRFGWDRSVAGEFGFKKPLYAGNATQEGYAVLFLAHSNFTGSTGGAWKNIIYDDKIEEFWPRSLFYKTTHSSDEVRVVLAKKQDGYHFIGVFKVDMDSLEEVSSYKYKQIKKVYRKISSKYPINN